MFRSGTFVAEHVEPVAEGAVQPNGVDLTVDAAFEQREVGRIRRSGKTIGDRRAVAPVGGGESAGDDESVEEEAGVLRLDPGGYVARYGERIRIPEGHVGFVLPRSSLLRNSCMLNTAVWDAGYEGRGEGLLQVHHPIEVDVGARIAQLVLARSDHEDTYDGSYQRENL